MSSVNRGTLAVPETVERNLTVGSSPSKYRPILANGGTLKKRGSEASIDGLKASADSTYNGKPSVGRPRKQRILDTDLTAVTTTMRIKERSMMNSSTLQKSSSFDWSRYLKDINATAIPTSFFTHVPLEVRNACQSVHGDVTGTNSVAPLPSSFTTDQCIEGVDPFNETVICALKITEVVGRRLRLRFLGYPEKYDFWTTVDSPLLFPIGWCAHNGRPLQPPNGCADADSEVAFDWEKYMAQEKLTPVPRHLLRVPWECPINDAPAHQFRNGYKLEAVDKRNPGVVCVATVKDAISDQVLIHFDGWDTGFDQWVPLGSQLLHPIGYCEDEEFVLSVPSEWNTQPPSFTWKQYLKQTNSKPVPKEAFEKITKDVSMTAVAKQPPVLAGQRLEVIDRRCPQLIRVANVVASVNPHPGFLSISYDGWAEKFNICVEMTSPDFFPVGYCITTGHPLQAPPGYEQEIELNGGGGGTTDGLSNSSASSSGAFSGMNCPTTGCRGFGHVKGPRFSTHQSTSGCPYAEINLKKDLIRPHERLFRSISTPVSETSPQVVRLDQATRRVIPESGQIMTQQILPEDPVIVTSMQPSPMSSSSASSPSLPTPFVTSSVTKPEMLPLKNIAVNGIIPGLEVDTKPPIPIDKAKLDRGLSDVTTILSQSPTPLDLSYEHDDRITKCASGSPMTQSPCDDSLDALPGTCWTKDHMEGVTTTLNAQVLSSFSNTDIANTNAIPPHPINTIPNVTTPVIAPSLPTSSGANPSDKFKIKPPKAIGSQKRTHTSDYPKSKAQQAHPRYSQLAHAVTEYTRQQQLFGLTGIPVKRKRGRPRKCSTLHLFPGGGGGGGVSQPIINSTPVSRGSNIQQQQPNQSFPLSPMPAFPSVVTSCSTTTGPLLPLSIYSPLTVSAPIPTTFYSSGPNPTQLLPGTQVTGYLNSISVSTSQIEPTLPSQASDQSTPSKPAWMTDVTGVSASGYNEPNSASTEPATNRSPIELNTLSSMQTQPSCSHSAYDFFCSNIQPECSTARMIEQPVVSLTTCVPPSAMLTGVDPLSTHTVTPMMTNDPPFTTTILPGWCLDSTTTWPIQPPPPPPSLPPPSPMCMRPTPVPPVPSNYPLFSLHRIPPTGLPPMPPASLIPGVSAVDPLVGGANGGRLEGGDVILHRLLPQANAALHASKLAGLSGPHTWTVDMVTRFVAMLPGCKQFACKFEENEIDGAALLCLEQHDLLQILAMKLGPAVKVAGAIHTLRRSLLSLSAVDVNSEFNEALAAAQTCFQSPSTTAVASKTPPPLPGHGPCPSSNDNSVTGLDLPGSVLIGSKSKTLGTMIHRT